MLFRRHRPTLLGAVLAFCALVSGGENNWAQPASSDSRPESGGPRAPGKTEVQLRGNVPPVPPAPGQLVSGPSTKGALERPKRVPPILIAFVLLFLITWVRAYLERRRLRALLRQSCELPPQPESPPQSYI
jgi:hypothetical protein